MRNFFAELKRRNVYKVAVAYAIVGWLVMQIAATIVPALHLSDSITSAVVVLVILGFPIALIFAWAFELTPEGITRSEDVAPGKSIARRTGRKLTALIVFVAIVAAVLFLLHLTRHKRAFATDNSAPLPATPKAVAAEVVPEKSVAVLPFQNLSKDQENAFFSDGVQDEILTDLARIADLKVISRTSVMQYKTGAERNLREIGKALGVAHVVEGSVQRSANRVRVNAQLIDARTDSHLWAQTYDRDLADVFAIQSEIAQTIADQLQARLSPKEKDAISERPTSDLAAYDLYLRAKELFLDLNFSRQKDNLLQAVQLLDQAVARDPTFLLAYCQLAYAHDEMYRGVDPTETRLALAETSVRAAVRLQPESGETHLAQAFHFYWGYLDYPRAREELAKAEAALPNNARIFDLLGLIDRRQGRWDEAVRNLERALDLDPRNAETLNHLWVTYSLLHRYGDAIPIGKRMLALQPRSPFLRAAIVGLAVDMDANTASIRATLNAIEAESPAAAADVAFYSFGLALSDRDPLAAARALANIPEDISTKLGSPFPHAWFEGILAKLRQDAPGAHAAFMVARAAVEKTVAAQPKDPNALGALGLIDAELGEKEKAIREARAACDMLPVSKDAMEGPGFIMNLANVYVLTGEKDLALEQLEIANKLPGGPTYGQLRLDPDWDSLRGDPRFEKIVASLAPKDGSTN